MNSMTGYGRLSKEINGHKYTIEMKSVNNKYCDISVKMPRILSFVEESVKKTIANKISRGKIDVYIGYEELDNSSKLVKINKNLAEHYINEIKEISEETEIETRINIAQIITLPEVLKISDELDEEAINSEVQDCLSECLDKFIEMRKKEGENIKQDLRKRIDSIAGKVETISGLSSRLIEDYVVKLEKRVSELMKTDVVDKTRLAQEVVIYADKSSVEEEITRLSSHLKQLNELMDSENKPIGKKLDFIIQEMNRETNTIGSKSGSVDITNLVIEMKVEIEDIREQIQNIE